MVDRGEKEVARLTLSPSLLGAAFLIVRGESDAAETIFLGWFVFTSHHIAHTASLLPSKHWGKHIAEFSVRVLSVGREAPSPEQTQT